MLSNYDLAYLNESSISPMLDFTSDIWTHVFFDSHEILPRGPISPLPSTENWWVRSVVLEVVEPEDLGHSLRALERAFVECHVSQRICFRAPAPQLLLRARDRFQQLERRITVLEKRLFDLYFDAGASQIPGRDYLFTIGGQETSYHFIELPESPRCRLRLSLCGTRQRAVL